MSSSYDHAPPRYISTTASILCAAAFAITLWLAPGTPAPAAAPQAAPWREVTPGPGLAGWRVTGGKAAYTAANGEVVGRAVPGKGNSWLVSDALYGDFILEYDAKTDPALNSGMMIRGQSRPDYRNGVVFGYQAE